MIAVVFASMPVPAADDDGADTSSRAENDRAVLVEAFTATNCGYCPGADGAMDRMIDNQGVWSSGYWPDRVSVLQWHIRSDPYQNSDSVARANYYSTSGTPTVWFDGVTSAVGGSQNGNNTAIDNWYKGKIDQRPATAPVIVDIDYTLDSDWKGGSYTVTYTGHETHSNTSLMARLALVEDINVSHGSAKFRFTGRKMLEDQSISVNNGDVVSINGTFTVSSSWDETKMGFVAWVQSDTTMEVLGSKQRLFPGNNAPEIVPGNYDVTMDEDTENTDLDLDDMFTDPEDQPLDFTVESKAVVSHITATVQMDNVLKFVPEDNWNGDENFDIKASDGTKETTNTITVTVNPVNDPPTVDPISDFSMNEGATDKHLDLDDHFSDIETAELDYTHSGEDQISIVINTNTHIVTFEAPEGYAGTETITFEATDEGGLSVSTDVDVTVKDVNYPPVIENEMLDITMDEDDTDSSIDLDNVFSDKDGDTLMFSVSNNQHIVVTINASNNVVTFAPEENWNGQETIIIEADDNIADPVSDSLVVTVQPVNDAPERIGDLEDIEMQEDGEFQTEDTLSELFLDVDGNALTYEVTESPENVEVTIEDDTSVSFVPYPDWNGETEVTLSASDGIESLDYVVPITVTPINDMPTIDSYLPDGDVLMDEGDSEDFSIVASDIDGDEVYYEWYLDGKQQESETNEFTYTTDSSSAGVHQVKVKVTDAAKETEHEWRVTVRNVNHAPQVEIVSPTPEDKLKEGTATLEANVSDVDGDDLKITWYVNGEAVPNSNKETISYKLKGGKNTIKVTVSDGETASEDTVLVKTTPKDGGDAPGFELVFLLGAVLVVAFLLRRRK